MVNLFEPTCKLEVILIFGAHGESYVFEMMYNEVYLEIFDQLLKKLAEEVTQDT